MLVECVCCGAILDYTELIYDEDLNTAFCPCCDMGDSWIEVDGNGG